MKTILFVAISIILVISTCSCKQQVDKTIDIASEVQVDLSLERTLVEQTMKTYKDALQNLTTKGTFELFAENATVFEQGKVEGTYKDYIDNHLGPELDHFKSFTFSDYIIDITVSLPYAFTTENYLYTIVLKGDPANGKKERTIESKGVATSILEKIDGEWKIVHSHSSFKKLNQ